MGSRGRHAARTTGVLLALLMSACGTRAGVPRQHAAPPVDGPSGAAPVTPGGATVPGGSPAALPPPADGDNQPGPVPGSSFSTTSEQVERAIRRLPARAPVEVGAVVVDNAGALVTSYGIPDLDTGDARAQVNAVVAALNAAGGLAHHPVKVQFAAISATSTNIEQDYASACATLTEDHHVIAVVNAAQDQAESFVRCLAKRGVPLLNSGGGLADDRLLRELNDTYVLPGGASLSRQARFYLDGLLAQGFFAPPATVGLVRVDDLTFARVSRDVIHPWFASHKLTLAREQAVSTRNSVSDVAQQMPGVVGQFEIAGVDHVLFMDDGLLGYFFANQAATQQYYPRYGLQTLNLPVLMQHNLPAQAMQDSVGVGWQPSLDVDSARTPQPNAATRRCLELMSRAGQSDVGRVGLWQEESFCDELFFLKQALDAAATSVTARFGAIVEAVGARFQSSITFKTVFGPGRHDGVAAVRYFSYSPACSCLRYTTGDQRVR